MPYVSNAAICTIYLIVFVDLFQISFVFPLLPSIAVSFGAGATKIGLLGTVAAAGEAIASPILGGLSDRIGRRPVLLLAIAGSAAASLLTGLADGYWMVVGARLLNGICGGTVGICSAYLADITDEEERPAYINYVSIPVSLGLAAGPAAGAMLNQMGGFQNVCFAAAAICILNVIAVLVILPESVYTTSGSSDDLREASLQSVGDSDISMGPDVAEHLPDGPGPSAASMRLPCGAWVVNIAGFLWGVGFASFEGFAALYIKDEYFDLDMDAATFFYCWLFVAIGVIILVFSLVLYMPLLNCLGLSGTIIIGGMIRAVGFFAGGVSPTKWFFLVSTVLWVAGEQAMGPSISTMLTLIVPPESFGKAIGWFQTFLNIARSLGPIAFGPIYDHNHKFPFYANGVLSIAVFVLLWVVSRGRWALAAEEVARNESLLNPPAARAFPPGRHLSRMESEVSSGRTPLRLRRTASDSSTRQTPAMAAGGSAHALRRVQSVQ